MKHYLELPHLSEYKRYFPMLLFFLFLLLFILQMFLFFFYDRKTVVTVPDKTPGSPPPVISLQSPLFHTDLFGKYLSPDAGIQASSLDVELVGIMYSKHEKNSQVLIKLGSGKEKVYHVGDKLPGGAVIRQIEKDRAVVFYRGALESLNLPKEELQFDEPPKPLFKE